jgi:hypothetical protein
VGLLHLNAKIVVDSAWYSWAMNFEVVRFVE